MPFSETAKYPSAIAGVADLFNQKNFLLGETLPSLASGISSVDSSFTVVSGTGANLPADNFVVTLEDEILFVGSRSGDVCSSLVRGVEGTSNASHLAGVTVNAFITAMSHNQLAAEVNAIETTLGINPFPLSISKGGLGQGATPGHSGEIPIWDSVSGTYVPGDPFVQGVYPPGANVATAFGGSPIQPVLIGGSDYAGSPLLRNLKVDVAGALYIGGGSIVVSQSAGSNLKCITDSGSVTAATLSAETTKVIGTVNQGTSPWTVAGGLTNNNAAPSTNNLSALIAIATARGTGLTQGNLTALSVDLSGSLRVRNAEASALADSILTGEHINQVELNFSQAFDSARITNTSNTSGGYVQGSGCATYSTGTGAAGAAKGVSVNTLDYRPGHEWYSYFTASFTAGAASSHQRIGPYNATDGFWIGYEGLTFGITQFQNSVLVGGTANSAPSVARASFNGDAANASANSKFTSNGTPVALDLTKINIWRLRGSWFGTAPVMFQVFSPDGEWVTLHTFLYPNTLATPFAYSTNWNMTVDVVNAGNTSNLAIVTPCWAMGTTGTLEELSDPVTDISLSLLTRSVIAGKLPSGAYANVNLSTDKALQISGSGNFTPNSYTFDPTHTVTQTIVNGLATYTTLTVEMIGTGSTISAGQLTLQGSLDNSNWVALWPFDVGGNTPLATSFYAAATGAVLYQLNIAGFPYVRVLNNVAVAGTGTPQVVFSYSLESLSTPSSVAITASNIHVSSAQGNAAAVSGAWPILVTDGTNTATVKAASTAAIATDSSLVVQLSPNQPALTVALNVHDASPASQAVTNTGTFAVQATLVAETTKVIGVVRNSDGAGNLWTSNSTTYTAKFAQDTNLLGTLGTAFTTAGFVDIKGADGNIFVRQTTAANLNATVVGTGTFVVQATLAAETTKVIGTVNQGTSPWVAAATLAAETTKVIGVVRTADGSGNLLTSTSNALDINIKSGSIANTSFIATQATGTNLHTVMDSGTVTAVTSITNPVSTTPAAPTTSVYSQAAISSTSNPVVVVAGSGTKTTRIFRIQFVNAGGSTTNITVQDSTTTNFSGAFPLVTNGSYQADGGGDPLFIAAAGKAFQLVNSASQQISGTVWYTQS